VQVRPRLSQAPDIMSAMCRDRQVVPGRVDLFLAGRVRKDCVRKSLQLAQIDDVGPRRPRPRPAAVICWRWPARRGCAGCWASRPSASGSASGSW
jgi:hypothetical protein